MLAGVGVACVSALFSWRSSKVAAKAAQATLYVKLHEQYASHEMLGDLRNLRSWKEDPANREDFAGRWAELRGKTDPNALEVDKSRRRVSHFFGAIADLYKHRLLSKPLARHFANYSGADLWFDVVEPLEEKLGEKLGRDYGKLQFDSLLSLRSSSGR